MARLRQFWRTLTKPQKLSMAHTAVVAAGIVVSAAVVIGVALWTDRPRTPEATPTSTAEIRVNLSSGNVKVQHGQTVLLASDRGAAILRFTFGPGGAAYEWRYRDRLSGSEIAGADILYELYGRTPIAEGSHVVDVGSRLSIEIDDFILEWSWATISSGWIYYDSIGLRTLDDGDFETFDLSTVMLFE